MSGYLLLEDGTVFRGRSVGAQGVSFGEAVFTTSMTGYQEIVTDPSFAEQILCFTSPMIGNYGVGQQRSESSDVHTRGVVMRQASGDDWRRWLHARGVVALDGIDTRSVVLRLRSDGACRSAVVGGHASVEDVLSRVRAQPEMAGRSLVAGVSTREPQTISRGNVRVGVVDYGCKQSILRRLTCAGTAVTIFPHDTSASDVLSLGLDGVLLSNGPGDPAALPGEVAMISELLGRVPILGICLGHQLLALAAGFETFKLPFGHRGANHPVLELATSRVLVTSQNHGFAVRGEGSDVTHVSLYDGTVEGLAIPSQGARSVQFHPEAGPGPHDAWPILESWVEEVRLAQAA